MSLKLCFSKDLKTSLRLQKVAIFHPLISKSKIHDCACRPCMYYENYKHFFSCREYYFSEENLQKDVFLRRKMDSEGFLPVTLVASFNRVRSLTNDVSFIVQAVQDSDIVEIKDGKFRPKTNPDSWPLTPDQPDPVISPKPEVVSPKPDMQLDSAPDTNVNDNDSNVRKTLNPNVPEFVPSFAAPQGI